MVQQDNQIGALSERIRSLQAEVEKWRHREEATTVSLSKQKENMIEGGIFCDSLSGGEGGGRGGAVADAAYSALCAN